METKNYNAEIERLKKELAEAEAAKAAEEEAKKKALSEARKQEADKVNDAFKTLNAAKRNYNETLDAAKRSYNETIHVAQEQYAKAVADAQKEFNDTIDRPTKILDTAQEKYDTEFDAFNAAHPEGFHMTLRDGDNVKTISKTSTFDIPSFDEIFNLFFGKRN